MADEQTVQDPEVPGVYSLSLGGKIGLWSRYLLSSGALTDVFIGRGIQFNDPLKPEFMNGFPDIYYRAYSSPDMSYTKWLPCARFTDNMFPNNPTNGEHYWGTANRNNLWVYWSNIHAVGQHDEGEYYVWGNYLKYYYDSEDDLLYPYLVYYWSNDNGESWSEFEVPQDYVGENICNVMDFKKNVIPLGAGRLNISQGTGEQLKLNNFGYTWGYSPYGVYTDSRDGTTKVPNLWTGIGKENRKAVGEYSVNDSAFRVSGLYFGGYKNYTFSSVTKPGYPGWSVSSYFGAGTAEYAIDQGPSSPCLPAVYSYGSPVQGYGTSELEATGVVGLAKPEQYEVGVSGGLEVGLSGTSFEFRPPTHTLIGNIVYSSNVVGTEGTIALEGMAYTYYPLSAAYASADIVLPGIVLELSGLEVTTERIYFAYPEAEYNNPYRPWPEWSCSGVPSGYHKHDGYTVNYGGTLTGTPIITSVSHNWNATELGYSTGQETRVWLDTSQMTGTGYIRFFFARIRGTNGTGSMIRTSGLLHGGANNQNTNVWTLKTTNNVKQILNGIDTWTNQPSENQYPFNTAPEQAAALSSAVGGFGVESLFYDASTSFSYSQYPAISPCAFYLCYQLGDSEFIPVDFVYSYGGPHTWESRSFRKPASMIVGCIGTNIKATDTATFKSTNAATMPLQYRPPFVFFGNGRWILNEYSGSTYAYIRTVLTLDHGDSYITVTRATDPPSNFQELSGAIERAGEFSWFDGTSLYTIETEGPSTEFPNRNPIGSVVTKTVPDNPLTGFTKARDWMQQEFAWQIAGDRTVMTLFTATDGTSSLSGSEFTLLREEPTAAPRRYFIKLPLPPDPDQEITVEYKPSNSEEWVALTPGDFSVNDDITYWNWLLFGENPFPSILPEGTRSLKVTYTPIFTGVYRFSMYDFVKEIWKHSDVLPKDFNAHYRNNEHNNIDEDVPRSWTLAYPLANRGWRIDSDENWIPQPVEPDTLWVVPTTFTVYAGEPFVGSAECHGGVPPYVWDIDGLELPPGLTANTSGVISGTVDVDAYAENTYIYTTFNVRDSRDPSIHLCATATNQCTFYIIVPVPGP